MLEDCDLHKYFATHDLQQDASSKDKHYMKGEYFYGQRLENQNIVAPLSGQKEKVP